MLKALERFGLTGLVFYAALKEVAHPPAEAAPPPVNRLRLIVKTVIITAVAGIILLAAGGLIFAFSGIYPIAADKPHFYPVRRLLKITRTRSVQLHSRGIQVPNLNQRQLVLNGFVLFRKNCQTCHGAPGIPADQVGLGINPKPPRLITANTDWTDAQLYWIVSHGLKMSGMPAFSPRLSDSDRWGIVAFMRRLPTISPADYQQLMAAADQGLQPTSWGSADEQGFAQLKSANPEKGKALLVDYGCQSCHAIPAIGPGDVGPPLADFAERQYIAGLLVNLPTNTMNWIRDPQRFKPKTAMPNLGVKAEDARDIAAYLYTLGGPQRIETLQHETPRF
ncbi:MAG TPA: c-type cytochrome [Bryobacteraceae bacterium]|nr:c-type cytochrome [Bryobacteraceae bacterium]